MRGHRLRTFNYMDDDTCEVLCSCGWESTGHEDESSAEFAHTEHAEAESEDDRWWS